MATVVSDSAGGVMARRLYPAAIAIPILLGQLTLLGETLRLYNGKFGLSLFLLTSIVVFVLLVSLTYRSLDRTDARAHAARRRAARGGGAATHRQGAARRGGPVADRAQAAPAGRPTPASRWCRRAALVDELTAARVEPLARSAAGDARRSRPPARARLAVRALHLADQRQGRVRARGLDGRMSPDRRDGGVSHRAGGAHQRRAPRRGAVGERARLARRRVAVACKSPTAARASTSRARSPPASRAGCRACASARRRSAARWTSSRTRTARASPRELPLPSAPARVQDGGERMKTQILLADDHQVIIDGLKALLSGEPDMEVIGQATDGLQVLPKVLELKPEVLVLDLMMPGLGGLEVARQLHDRAPATKVIILSMHSNDAYVVEALRNGAVGYVLKHGGGARAHRRDPRGARGRALLVAAAVGRKARALGARRQSGAVRSVRHALDARARSLAARRRGADIGGDRRAARRSASARSRRIVRICSASSA